MNNVLWNNLKSEATWTKWANSGYFNSQWMCIISRKPIISWAEKKKWILSKLYYWFPFLNPNPSQRREKYSWALRQLRWDVTVMGILSLCKHFFNFQSILIIEMPNKCNYHVFAASCVQNDRSHTVYSHCEDNDNVDMWHFTS